MWWQRLVNWLNRAKWQKAVVAGRRCIAEPGSVWWTAGWQWAEGDGIQPPWRAPGRRVAKSTKLPAVAWAFCLPGSCYPEKHRSPGNKQWAGTRKISKAPSWGKGEKRVCIEGTIKDTAHSRYQPTCRQTIHVEIMQMAMTSNDRARQTDSSNV